MDVFFPYVTPPPNRPSSGAAEDLTYKIVYPTSSRPLTKLVERQTSSLKHLVGIFNLSIRHTTLPQQYNTHSPVPIVGSDSTEPAQSTAPIPTSNPDSPPSLFIPDGLTPQRSKETEPFLLNPVREKQLSPQSMTHIIPDYTETIMPFTNNYDGTHVPLSPLPIYNTSA